MTNPMRAWLDAASKDEKRELARRAETTMGMISQIGGGYRNKGRPQVRSGLARRLELAAAEMRKSNKALPELLRTDLSGECRDCEFARKCLGSKAVATEFEVLPGDDE